MQNKLKPCPFCGGEAGISEVEEESLGYNEIINYEVGCPRCRIETLALRDLDDVIKRWNTRQPAFDWKPIEELTEEILTTKEKIPFIMMYQAKEPDFYHKYGSIGIFILAKNDNDEFLICSNSSNWTVPLSKISETVFTHYKIITPPQTNQS